MRRLLLIAGTLAAAVSLSGCFGFIHASFTSLNLHKGETTKAKMVARSVNPKGPKVYPLVIAGYPADDSVRLVGKPRFDTGGSFGGPFEMVRADAIRDALLESEACLPLYLIETLHKVRIYRTKEPVKPKPKTGKLAKTSLKFKQVARSGEIGYPFATAIGNFFDDDGDGIYTDASDDSAVCSGGQSTIIRLEPLPVKSAPRLPDLAAKVMGALP